MRSFKLKIPDYDAIASPLVFAVMLPMSLAKYFGCHSIWKACVAFQFAMIAIAVVRLVWGWSWRTGEYWAEKIVYWYYGVTPPEKPKPFTFTVSMSQNLDEMLSMVQKRQRELLDRFGEDLTPEEHKELQGLLNFELYLRKCKDEPKEEK